MSTSNDWLRKLSLYWDKRTHGKQGYKINNEIENLKMKQTSEKALKFFSFFSHFLSVLEPIFTLFQSRPTLFSLTQSMPLWVLQTATNFARFGLLMREL
jgi:transposase-like protein